MMEDLKTTFLENINSCMGIIQRICMVYEWEPEARKDLYQEILYQSWKSYPSFRGGSKFSTWLYRVALNTGITHYKTSSGKLRREQHMELIPDMNEQNEHSEEMLNELYRAIYSLGKVDKALILLFLEGRKYEDIAEIMGMTSTNVGVRLLRAKKQLETMIKDDTRN